MITLLILGFTALFASALSAIVGMGGGVILLGVMALVLSPQLVVPLHGVVQLASNTTRTIVFLRHVNWTLVGIFGVFITLGVGAAAWLWTGGSVAWIKPLIGLFILFHLGMRQWAPTLRNPPLWAYAPLGVVAGFLTLYVGATGPLIAPFFLRDDLDNEGVIATKAMCQTIGHVLKIPAFLAIGFDYFEHVELLGILLIVVIGGTLLGKRVLGHLSNTVFTRLFLGVLTLLALALAVTPFLPHS